MHVCVCICMFDVCGVCTVSVCAVCVCSVGGEILVSFKQSEVVSFVKKWIKLENVILRKSNQSRARIYTRVSSLKPMYPEVQRKHKLKA